MKTLEEKIREHYPINAFGGTTQDELVEGISLLIMTEMKEQKKTLRKRHFQEFLIIADEIEKRGWSFDKFLTYMCLINEKTSEELRLLTKTK